MSRGIGNDTEATTVPLKTAMLCIDCETVSGSRCDECPVCHSRSVFSLARMLGGSLVHPDEDDSLKSKSRFDLKITIGLEQTEAKDLNAAVEGITSLLSPNLGRGLASLHIVVEPVPEPRHAYGLEAA